MSADQAVPVEGVTEPKLWTNRAISLATFFGGAIGGFFLLAENAATLGQPRVAKRLRLAGFAITILIALLAMLTPVGRFLGDSSQIFPVTCLVVVESYWYFRQKARVKLLLKSGVCKHSIRRLIGWTLAGCALSLLIPTAMAVCILLVAGG